MAWCAIPALRCTRLSNPRRWHHGPVQPYDTASSAENTPGRREVRDELQSAQFQAASKKFLKELRSQAWIEYK